MTELEQARAFIQGLRDSRLRGPLLNAIEPVEREVFAARLLASDAILSNVRDRLMTRYRVSRSTAYEIIAAALDRPMTLDD